MTPKEYYYEHFREDFQSFWKSLDENGTTSRVGAQQRGEFPQRTMTDPNYSDARHFSVADLIREEQRDNLENIPADRQLDFLIGVFYTVFIDQVMHSHHRDIYAEFKKLTEYPKMDRTAGLAFHLMMANPYEVFTFYHDRTAFSSRAISKRAISERFPKWCDFIVSDLEAFFADHQFDNLSWADVRAGILADRECFRGDYGRFLRDALEKAPA
ncbi:MAG: hypothetical protein MPK11_03110 [Gammaproteobacteria bacterium]|nr:hypothetical protein [Gammaproteobacteria bacterium]CAJ2376489.1 MAG: hypothetical protein IBGAMO2_350021 [Arenicellales bacterium IbO2]MDA7961551.1 hypothetical protein [Gammaproteobacteria bacterium]MDA7969756.1 hypothetical protein [Gammaproteobacteria bacterium]MDA7996127.1 hypothetical protein [Gammaproteobacteria bacterium]